MPLLVSRRRMGLPVCLEQAVSPRSECWAFTRSSGFGEQTQWELRAAARCFLELPLSPHWPHGLVSMLCVNTALVVLTNTNHLATSSAEATWTPGADASVSAPQLLLLLSIIKSSALFSPLSSPASVTASRAARALFQGCCCPSVLAAALSVVSGPSLSLSKQREKEALAGGFTRISIHLRKR